MLARERWERMGTVTLPSLSACQQMRFGQVGTVGSVLLVAMCVCVHVRAGAREE